MKDNKFPDNEMADLSIPPGCALQSPPRAHKSPILIRPTFLDKGIIQLISHRSMLDGLPSPELHLNPVWHKENIPVGDKSIHNLYTRVLFTTQKINIFYNLIIVRLFFYSRLYVNILQTEIHNGQKNISVSPPHSATQCQGISGVLS